MIQRSPALALIFALVMSIGCGVPAAQAVSPAAFASPEDGFAALAEAARLQDPARLARVLGDEGRRLLRSGDTVADAAALARFAEAYDARHEIVRPSPDRAEIQVGLDAWPLPIPMELSGSVWRFDPQEGSDEIIARRIGQNELDTIETLRAIADAQADYADTAGRDGVFRAYARRFVSTPGTHDGLYWESKPGEPQSPLGAFVSARVAEGYTVPRAGEAPRVIHGYLFRIVDAQGPAAVGGAMSYIVDGRMTGGFGVLAWPVTYGSSGVQTFMVDAAGVVWQRDLGRSTAATAPRIDALDPSPGWTKVPE